MCTGSSFLSSGLRTARSRARVSGIELFARCGIPVAFVSAASQFWHKHESSCRDEQYLFGRLESRDGHGDALAQSSRRLTPFALEVVSDDLELLDPAGHRPPRIILELDVALAVKPKIGIVLALDEPVPSLVAI